jgi:hypothetical protein
MKYTKNLEYGAAYNGFWNKSSPTIFMFQTQCTKGIWLANSMHKKTAVLK